MKLNTNNLDQAWAQELMWVKRNKAGVIVGISKKLPEGVEFIPSVGTKEKDPLQRVSRKNKLR